MSLILNVMDNDIMKSNLIKDGDICSVFMQMDHGFVKSYRGDFQITFSYIYKTGNTSNRDTSITIRIDGELYIPNLYNGQMTFSFAGTSRDALIDVSKKLGLGFFFCDDENTKDAQLWYCVADGT